MKRGVHRLLLAAGMAAAAAGALAQADLAGAAPAGSAPAARPLALAEALTLALDRHAGVAAAQAQARAAQALAGSAAVVAAPVLKLSADRDEATASQGAGPVRNKLAVAWAPPQPGEPALRRQQLQLLAGQQAGLADGVRQRVGWEVRRLHATLRWHDALLRTSDQAQALQARLLEAATAQVGAGRRTRAEWLALRSQQLEAEAAHALLRAEQAVAANRLRTLIGWPEDAPLVLQPLAVPTGVADVPQDSAGLAARALAQRADLQAAAARCGAVDADTRLKDLDNRRWLKGVELTWQPQRANKAGNIELTLEVTWPLGGERNGNPASLDALRRACQAEQDDLAATAGQEVRNALAQLGSASLLARQQLAQVDVLQEAASLADAARAVGRADDTDVQAARLAVAKARLQALRRQMEVQLAELALQQAVGQVVGQVVR